MKEGLCDKKKRKQCILEFGKGQNLEWTCSKCPKKPAEDISPYTRKLMRIRTLKKAGYPLRANDLGYEEWMDLGMLCQALDIACPFIGSGSSNGGKPPESDKP